MRRQIRQMVKRGERVTQCVVPQVCLTYLFTKQEAHEDTPVTGQLDNFLRDVTQVCENAASASCHTYAGMR